MLFLSNCNKLQKSFPWFYFFINALLFISIIIVTIHMMVNGYLNYNIILISKSSFDSRYWWTWVSTSRRPLVIHLILRPMTNAIDKDKLKYILNWWSVVSFDLIHQRVNHIIFNYIFYKDILCKFTHLHCIFRKLKLKIFLSIRFLLVSI